MLSRVRDDRALTLKAVRRSVLPALLRVDFIDAVLKKARQPALYKLQGVGGCLGRAVRPVPVWNLKRLVLLGVRKVGEDVRESLRFDAQQLRQVFERHGRLEQGEARHY